MRSVVSCVVGRGCLLWPVRFSWQNSVSLCPASFCTPSPNLPVTPDISWLSTFVPPRTPYKPSLNPWCWERLKARGEGDKRGWDGWMVSLTQWTWVWANSRKWWRTGKPGMPQSMGLKRVRHNLATKQQQQHYSTYPACQAIFQFALFQRDKHTGKQWLQNDQMLIVLSVTVHIMK